MPVGRLDQSGFDRSLRVHGSRHDRGVPAHPLELGDPAVGGGLASSGPGGGEELNGGGRRPPRPGRASGVNGEQGEQRPRGADACRRGAARCGRPAPGCRSGRGSARTPTSRQAGRRAGRPGGPWSANDWTRVPSWKNPGRAPWPKRRQRREVGVVAGGLSPVSATGPRGEAVAPLRVEAVAACLARPWTSRVSLRSDSAISVSGRRRCADSAATSPTSPRAGAGATRPFRACTASSRRPSTWSPEPHPHVVEDVAAHLRRPRTVEADQVAPGAGPRP